ncbi:MAG: DUF4493 domain-containing protein [Muribaculaceae bacterium]|nr:DUF4493 domain-containing protein [Muribaculaceae bacterium]
MKLTTKGFSTAALASFLLLGGCANESPWSSGNGEAGRISLKVAANGNVQKSTRADDNVSPVIPAPDQFSISLNSTDQSYSKTWSSPDAFNREGGFPMGTYTLAAVYGNIEEEGFSNPCFQGETPVAVRLGEETSATVTASLANSMVSIRYTDEFRAMFPKYNALLTSEGHVTPVVLSQNEDRPAYMSPRKITFSLSLTNQQGKEVTVVPAVFTAQPQHHYVVIVGVEEKVGVSTLDVSFDENVVTDSRDILLTDELFTTPAPSVSVNEDATSTISAFEMLPVEGKNPELHAIAFGGISKATLAFTAEDGGSLPLTSSEYELTGLSAANEEILKKAGVECSGFISKGEIENKMAVVNLSNFTKNLTPGTYKVSLTVQDKMGRTSDASQIPVVEIKVENLKLTIDKNVAPKYLEDKVEVALASNCNYVGNNLEFEIDGKVAKVVAVTSQGNASADMPYNYVYTLQYPSKDGITDSGCNVALSVAGKKFCDKVLDVDMPAYTVEEDAFANKVMLRLNYQDAEMLKHIIKNVVLYDGSNKIPESRIVRSVETNIIEVKSLTPSTETEKKEYKDISLSLGSSLARNKTKVNDFSTEIAAGVPNGDFEELHQTINETIQQGGKWARTVAGELRQTNLTMKVKEPIDWSSSNSMTCNSNSSNKNSWYMVPSVYNTTIKEDGWLSHQPKIDVLQKAHDTTAEIYKIYSSQSKTNAMLIRNVAWDSDGKAIKDDKGTYGISNYYSHNIPSSIANRTAGSMWLGVDGQEGKAFDSRPAKLKGFYQFVADSQDPNEQGVVEIQILNGDKVIGSAKKELKACSGYTEFILPIQYVAISELFKVKATSLRISFTSSNRTSNIKTTNYCNKDECVSRGAMLIVDNLTFEY